MSLIDSKLEFSSKQDVTGAASGSPVYSENIIDLGLEENHLTGNRYGAGYINIQFVGAPVEPASTNMVISLEHSDDGADFDNVASYSILANTERKCTQKLPKALKRYLRLKYSADAEIESGNVDAFIGVPLAEH